MYKKFVAGSLIGCTARSLPYSILEQKKVGYWQYPLPGQCSVDWGSSENQIWYTFRKEQDKTICYLPVYHDSNLSQHERTKRAWV